MPSQINQKTVAKNTLMLYIRMGVMMIVSLYTSRVVLATLGVDDFGIYNVVGGVIVMFSFLNVTLTVAIRRFLAYELGKDNNQERIQNVFNSSIIAVLIASIIIVIGLETIGLWFLNTKLNIPQDRMGTANYVFQLSILAFFFNMNLVPFSSAIVAYEKMGVYSYLGIAETMLKLGLVLSLPFLPGDKLRWYGLLIATLSILMAFCNYFYCWKKIISPHDLFKFHWVNVRAIFTFSAWAVFGSLVAMFATQGVNIIYNIFYGVAINAALGVAQHVAGASNQFVANFQTAFNPQLTKSYSAEGLSETTFKFVCQTSRLSILLVLIIGIPIIANVTPILELWLVDVPNYASAFTVIFILYSSIDGISGPLYLLVYAKGDLKAYQIVLSVIQFIYVVLVYVLCFLGFQPELVLMLYVMSAIVVYIARLFILKNIMQFPIYRFVKTVIIPIIIPLVLFTILCVYGNVNGEAGSVMVLLIKVFVMVLIVAITLFVVYLDKEERQFVFSIVNNIIHRS